MARRTTTPPPDEDFEERIVDIDVSEEMRASYLEYAYSVIYQRALPDARDGLKPVQRRILYSMSEMGLRPDRGHVKSSRVVGDVMGKLHPHGDTAIYDALVRMAQPFSMRLPLVDGHGNFGSPDDLPAAMRYTEARLAASALLMVQSIDEDTVDFKPNYDGQETEPTVLPAAFPNLLVNGASGIAVGMATNMAPHNLGEVIAAARHLIKRPDATLEELMRFVPGPDLPTGGTIIGLSGVRDAYEKGRGTFKMRAKATIEQVTPRRKGIVITELPFNVGPERVVTKMKELVTAKKLNGIADLKDLTDRHKGLRLVIEIKNGFHPEAVLEELYRLTPMEETFGINNVALVDGQPRTLGLRELLQVYVDHRLEVVRRRSAHRRRKREERLHLVDGLLIALLNIDEVIRIVRSSDDTAQARAGLMETFELSEIQANYILDTPLRRLTRYDKLELDREKETLSAEIASLTEILSSEDRLRQVVSKELAEVAKTYGTPRRTVLLESSGAALAAAVPLEVADDPCLVLLSSTGLLARTTDASPLSAEGERAAHDVLVSVVRSTVRTEVGVVTSLGRLIRVPVVDLPTLPPSANPPTLAGGHPVSEFVTLTPGETVVGLGSLDPDGPGLALGTAQGVVKRVVPEYPANRDDFEVIGLRDGDTVVGAVELTSAEHDLVFITSDAQLLRYPASSVRPQGRPAGGMAGIRLDDGARVIWFGVVDPEQEARVVTIAGSSTALPGTQVGGGKISDYAEFPPKGRATGGVRAQRFLKGEDVLLLAWAGPAPVKAVSSVGKPVPLPEELGRRDGSGVRLTHTVAAIGGALGSTDLTPTPGDGSAPADQDGEDGQTPAS
ncbi:DNA gyrase/topoisomerase IV subunit A [Microtetraspora niveoalba]|uniref:DNA gyrase/topoisomerase IV subunit A n=1 Tax=Microtetraspora niveoalba TaxID=46175 RepID=UPI00083439BC|nr:DNA topoisomerase IV subunit A [Microtetraspora niveoalba]